MSKFKFKDLPSEETPINAENLNKLNNVAVSVNEPTGTDKEEVWVKYSPNLHNKNTIVRGYELNSSNGNAVVNSEYYVSDYVPITPNTKVTVSGKTSGSSYCFYNSNKTFISTVTLSGWVGTLTTPNNSAVAYMRYNGRITELVNDIKVMVGDSITNPTINVNNNGSYETVAYKNVYSTSEVVIGEWMGKPLYRKIIEFKPTTAMSSIPHNISNLEKITNYYGTVFTTGSKKMFPTIYTSNMATTGTGIYDYNTTILEVNCGTSILSTITSIECTLEYTKTTD